MTHISPWIRPLSWPFSAITWLRNTLYSKGIIRSEAPFGKSIVLGNLALGGTGKTPHTDYLLHLLKGRKVAVLSRGYGRRSKGYRPVQPGSLPDEVGDEPLLLALKHPEATVAVCEDRLEGLHRLHAEHASLELALLDDALQHRRLKGGLNLLLSTWQRPFTRDALLPAGSLRDHPLRARDAHAIIVSKTPATASAAHKEALLRELAYLGKPVFFSGLRYAAPRLFSAAAQGSTSLSAYPNVLLLSAIANANLFEAEARRSYPVVEHLRYRDHHRFGKAEVERIREFIGKFAPGAIALLTTEKDAVRLQPLLPELQSISLPCYSLGIEVDFGEQAQEFQKFILNYVES